MACCSTVDAPESNARESGGAPALAPPQYATHISTGGESQRWLGLTSVAAPY